MPLFVQIACETPHISNECEGDGCGGITTENFSKIVISAWAVLLHYSCAHSPTTRCTSNMCSRSCSSANPSAKNLSAASLFMSRVSPSERNAAGAEEGASRRLDVFEWRR